MIMHGELILIGEHIYPVHDTRMLKNLLKYLNYMEKMWSCSPAIVYLEAPLYRICLFEFACISIRDTVMPFWCYHVGGEQHWFK